MKELIKEGEEELLYIDSVFDSLTRASSETDIAQLRAELAEQGYIRAQKGKQKPPKPAPPLQFISSVSATALSPFRFTQMPVFPKRASCHRAGSVTGGFFL